MRDELRKAFAATKGLTSEELGQLKAHIQAMVALGPSSAERVVTSANHSDWVLMAIVDYMRLSGIETFSLTVLAGGKHYDAFKQKLPAIHSYLKLVGDKNRQRALLKIGIALLHADLVNMRLAVTPRLMMAHIHRLPGVINRQFPGYAQSGYLGLIIRGENHVRKKSSKRPVQRARSGTASK